MLHCLPVYSNTIIRQHDLTIRHYATLASWIYQPSLAFVYLWLTKSRFAVAQPCYSGRQRCYLRLSRITLVSPWLSDIYLLPAASEIARLPLSCLFSSSSDVPRAPRPQRWLCDVAWRDVSASCGGGFADNQRKSREKSGNVQKMFVHSSQPASMSSTAPAAQCPTWRFILFDILVWKCLLPQLHPIRSDEAPITRGQFV